MNRRHGFTLIEILVVIGIIALLASVILVGLSPARARGRDARRITDMSQMQNAMELYFSRCGYYPSSAPPAMGQPGCSDAVNMTAATNWQTLESALKDAVIANRVPDDPLATEAGTAGRHYVYFASGSNPSAYVMAAVLEGSAADLANDIDDLTGNYPAALKAGMIALQATVNSVTTGCADPGNYCVGVF